MIAGKDPLDPRQGTVETQEYSDALKTEDDEFVIGVLADGFGFDQSEDVVDETVTEALDRFEANSDVQLRDVSVPEHEYGMEILDAVAAEGMLSLVRNDGLSRFVSGRYDGEFADAFGGVRRTRADDFPPTLKFVLVLAEYLSDRYKGKYYAMGQNLARRLGELYDEVLADVDVLAMPTLPYSPPEVLEDPALEELLARQLDMRPNTAPFDATGHPAISIPCGTANDLPVGLMFVGDQFADDTVLATADSFEQDVGWDL